MKIFEETFPFLKNKTLIGVLSVWMLVCITASVVGLVIFVGSRKPESSMENGEPVLYQSNGEVIPGEGLTLRIENPGVEINIFQNSITVSGSISLALQEPNLFSSIPPIWNRSLIISLEFFDPNGVLVKDLEFSTIINICFFLDDERWANQLQNPADFQVQFWNEKLLDPAWEEIPSFGKGDKQQYCGIADHLTLFALAIREAIEPVETELPYEIPEEPILGLGDAFSIELEDPNIRLVIPPEAGLFEGSLIMSREKPDLFPEDPPEWNRSPSVNIKMFDAEDNEIEGIVFNSPIALCFQLLDEFWEQYLNQPANFEIQFYEEDITEPQWETLEMIEILETQELCGAVEHLTLFSLAVRIGESGQETPTPGPYDP